jgi:hypothetical protein
VRLTFLALAMALTLGGCGWLGIGHKDEDNAAASAAARMPSDEILKKDCTDETWKQQNLGLWYSVCRQPMRW